MIAPDSPPTNRRSYDHYNPVRVNLELQNTVAAVVLALTTLVLLAIVLKQQRVIARLLTDGATN